MNKHNKSLQLQIRISPEQKEFIKKSAQKASLGMSDWVLSQILPSQQFRFTQLLEQFKSTHYERHVLAEIHDLFESVSTLEFQKMVSHRPSIRLTEYWENYIAAMIEYASYRKEINSPDWTKEIQSLKEPVFGADLESLRIYLLTHSPIPFRRRNIFIDSSIGQRV